MTVAASCMPALCGSRCTVRPFTRQGAPYRPMLRRSPVVASQSGNRSTDEDAKLRVPDTPPAPSTPQQQRKAEEATASQDLTVEEIQRRAAQLQAATQQQQQAAAQQPVPAQPGKESLVQGVLEEVFLIKWPSPRQAILNTFLVITIVVGTSALLFAVNTLLTELSRKIYG